MTFTRCSVIGFGVVPVLQLFRYRETLNNWAKKAEQTVQTQPRLLLEEQSGQGLHCLPFDLHFSQYYCSIKINVPNTRQLRQLFEVSHFLDI